LLKASGVIKPFKFSPSAFKCLQYLNGTYSIDQISQKTGLALKEVTKVISNLRRVNLLSHSEYRNNSGINRFRNQLNFFADFETSKLSRNEMQNRIRNSKVVVVGLGSIGTWVVYSLALVGVKKFTLIDPDIVEVSNLNRQCLFNNDEIGLQKTEIIAQKLKLLEKDINCILHNIYIKSLDEIIPVIKDSNLVINCADEPDIDYVNRIITQACFTLKIPHILCGGYDGHLSFLGPTVIPGKSACWYCYENTLTSQKKLSDYKHLTLTPADIQGGNLAPLSAITANYHVVEAIKLLSGYSRPFLLNKAAEIDFLNYQIYIKKFQRKKSCKFCWNSNKS